MAYPAGGDGAALQEHICYIYSFDEEVDLLNTYTLGIDIGSTTVKIAILDENDRLLFADYERHFANIRRHWQIFWKKQKSSLEK